MSIPHFLQLLRDIKDVSFATVDMCGRPQNRIIDVMKVTESGLYFLTARGKDFYHELMANGQVAIIGLNKEWQAVRLNGRVKKVDDRSWLDLLFLENPSMEQIYPGDSRHILDIFCVFAGHGEVLSLAQNPLHRESFSFGDDQAVPHGFHITDACIECDTCVQNCPQRCISAGTPYVINQSHCLHCGLCFENCPGQAIEPLRANEC